MTARGRVGKCHFQSAICIQWPLKAVTPHDAGSTVGAPEFIVHPPGNHVGVVNDVALSLCEHALDRQEPVGVDAHPVRQRRFQGITPLSGQTMAVTGCVYIGAFVHRVVDVRLLGANFSR